MENKINGQIKNFLNKYSLLNASNVFIVAFSGGYDSMCLLDILHNLSLNHKFTVIAAHLNHNWRGEESKQEEENCKKYCEQRNLTFYCETLSENLPHTELEARNRRYDFFNNISRKFNANAILTGHTITDQVETVLYRIIKSTGLNGLKGIPEVRHQENAPSIYRPILELTREETINYCKLNNLSPNVDSSNFQEKYVRNRLRLSLIPELKTYNSNFEQSILRLSTIASESEDLIEECLVKIKQDLYTENNELKTAEFLALSPQIQKRIILDFLKINNIEYSFEKISEILNFIKELKNTKSGNTLSLTTGSWLFASSKIIKVIYQIKSNLEIIPVKLNIEGCTEHFEMNKIVKFSVWNKEIPIKFPSEKSNTALVDLSKINEPLYLRTRQSGDKIQPFGMKEKVRLKKYLINKGIPEFERDYLPLITTDSEVLWVVGVGMSNLIKVEKFPSHLLEVFSSGTCIKLRIRKTYKKSY